jgi:hypothetical protein
MPHFCKVVIRLWMMVFPYLSIVLDEGLLFVVVEFVVNRYVDEGESRRNKPFVWKDMYLNDHVI